MVITRVIDFPDGKAKSMIIRDGNGDYNLYINARCSAAAQEEGYLHEIRHLIRNDFEKTDVQQIEADAHKAM